MVRVSKPPTRDWPKPKKPLESSYPTSVMVTEVQRVWVAQSHTASEELEGNKNQAPSCLTPRTRVCMCERERETDRQTDRERGHAHARVWGKETGRLRSGPTESTPAPRASNPVRCTISTSHSWNPSSCCRTLSLHSQHPQSQFIYLWFNERQMLRPGTWKPRKFQFQAHSLQPISITTPYPGESRGTPAIEPAAVPSPQT